MKKCSECKYGPYSSSSDFCDGCMQDPDTGWGGFTDHRAGRHFDNKEEQKDFYENSYENEDDIKGDY